MSSFDKREQAFEKKEAMDAEKQFKISSRRNRLLAYWAADLLGYDEAQKEAYAKEVIASDFVKAGDTDVHEKIMRDLEVSNVVMTEDELREKMDEFWQQAYEHINKQQ